MISSLKMKSFFPPYLGCVLKLYIMDRRCSEVLQTSSSYVRRRAESPFALSQERGSRALITRRAQIISMDEGETPRSLLVSPVEALCSESTLPSFLISSRAINERGPRYRGAG